jgi:hypothetical protein
MDKTSTIEYVENIYGLATNYLKHHSSSELESLMIKLEDLETKYELCNDEKLLKEYERLLKDVIDGMEVIMNE